MPFIPDLESRTVYRETLPGARYASFVLKRGFSLQLVDVSGRANLAMLLYNPDHLLERYNAPDTLKGQHTSKLTRGHMLYSDMGRVMLSVVDDSLGWHDTIGGVSDAAMVRARYGEHRYQEHRNDFHRDGRELFLIELAKWGLGARDLMPNLNWFSKVAVAENGTLGFAEGHGGPGAEVHLRAEMDTLLVMNTAPHPMDPSPVYDPGAVDLAIYRTPTIDIARDPCINARPENARAWANTAIAHAQEIRS
jgi:hypothetical protein